MRDVARKAIGNSDDIQISQRTFVQAAVSAYKVADQLMINYMSVALQNHMSEAILPDPMEDYIAQSWLDYSDEGIIQSEFHLLLNFPRIGKFLFLLL